MRILARRRCLEGAVPRININEYIYKDAPQGIKQAYKNLLNDFFGRICY